jgi:hypothetical protein
LLKKYALRAASRLGKMDPDRSPFISGNRIHHQGQGRHVIRECEQNVVNAAHLPLNHHTCSCDRPDHHQSKMTWFDNPWRWF